MTRAVYISAARYRRHSYGANHPLGIPRVSLTTDLIDAYGALDEAEFLQGRKAADLELAEFHDPAYLDALKRIEATGKVRASDRQTYNLGTLENPRFEGVFTTPAVATGSSIQGAEQVLAGRMAFNPAGGMHHAAPAQARGFCYFNDPALGVLRLRRAGWRVLYWDIDAHHGDGVEAAFRFDPEVVTVSSHMDPARGYPFAGGGLDDTGDGAAPGTAVNLPLPSRINDAEFAAAFDGLWGPVTDAFQPDAVVLQCGTDALFMDPLSDFRVSTPAFLGVVERIIGGSAPHLLVTGGGGYHPIALARAWTGVWALLSGRELPDAIPAAGREALEAVDWELDEDEDYFPALFERRSDGPCEGPVRDEVASRIEHLRRHHPLLRGRTGANRTEAS
jgi:acetoin utilization protein AcuC